MLPHSPRVCINKQAFCNAVTSRFLLQAALSHGLQHENALVRYATLCVLCRTFSSLRLLMTDLAAAADLAALSNEERRQQGSGFNILSSGGSASAAAQWAAWGGRLGGWLRGRLPEPQVLLALHSALQAAEVRPGKAVRDTCLHKAVRSLSFFTRIGYAGDSEAEGCEAAGDVGPARHSARHGHVK